FEVEKYPTLFQMTSTIEADVCPRIKPMDVLQKLFPCGSIAGTPKRDSMELIAELEQLPRGVYCGAIGYITPEQEAIFNVAIRTVSIDMDTKKARYGSGGAITVASTV